MLSSVHTEGFAHVPWTSLMLSQPPLNFLKSANTLEWEKATLPNAAWIKFRARVQSSWPWHWPWLHCACPTLKNSQRFWWGHHIESIVCVYCCWQKDLVLHFSSWNNLNFSPGTLGFDFKLQWLNYTHSPVCLVRTDRPHIPIQNCYWHWFSRQSQERFRSTGERARSGGLWTSCWKVGEISWECGINSQSSTPSTSFIMPAAAVPSKELFLRLPTLASIVMPDGSRLPAERCGFTREQQNALPSSWCPLLWTSMLLHQDTAQCYLWQT